MGIPNIYVAGPVARPEAAYDWNVNLEGLYDHIERAASEARVQVFVPRFENGLDNLNASAFEWVITERIQRADGMLVLALDARTAAATSAQYSIGCEAQKGAAAGLTMAVVAESPQRVPRLMLALTRDVGAYPLQGADFRRILSSLVQGEATAMS